MTKIDWTQPLETVGGLPVKLARIQHGGSRATVRIQGDVGVRDYVTDTGAHALGRMPDIRNVAPPAPKAEAPAGPFMFGIGAAVILMLSGHKVARSGWNGKDMFVYHVGANAYPAQSKAAKEHFGDDALVPYGAYVAMKTAEGTVVPWLCSQTDLLANDWGLAA